MSMAKLGSLILDAHASGDVGSSASSKLMIGELYGI